ncbi:MAG: hypothetical protein D4S02_11095 [Rhodocyclaceae bacterium]|nr:MAG: hypothetical protein D4S02_11095 [Rhodocyclaceae bacterium]
MKRHYHLIATAFAIQILGGCLGGQFNLGSSANPPVDVKLVAGDSSVTVTWSMAPNVEYWIFSAPVDSISTDGWARLIGVQATINAVSPQVVTGLANGLKYSFTVNGRVDGGPGGPGSTSVSVVPRIAGGEWSVGTPLANDLRGVAFGTLFVAVGANGALFSSPDFNSWTPVTWTPQKNPLAGLPDLNAVTYGIPGYLAAGAGGTLLLSTDAITWTAQSTGTTSNLYALASNGGSLLLAAGANGTIISSADGKTWTAANSGTTQDLFGLTYGNGNFVAVGANGTVLTSIDGTTWNLVASNASKRLNSVTYGVNSTTAVATFVAVGDAGTLITSIDGATWTVQSPITSSNLASVTYGRQFVAVGDTGALLTSADGSTWQARASGTVNDLRSVARSAANYSAVGMSGTNLSSI